MSEEEEIDYTQHIIAAMDSYGIVTSHRTEANPTEDQLAELARNERHLWLKMKEEGFVAALSAEQKANIEALNISL